MCSAVKFLLRREPFNILRAERVGDVSSRQGKMHSNDAQKNIIHRFIERLDGQVFMSFYNGGYIVVAWYPYSIVLSIKFTKYYDQ